MILVNIGEDESKIRKIIDSEIVYQTLTSSVKKLGEGEEKVIYLPSDIDSWTKDAWVNEVKAIIYASNKLFIEGEGEQKKVNFDKLNGDTNTLLQTVVDLYDDTNENDDLSKVLQSLIIVKTISEQIIKLSKENDIINTNGVISYSLDEWKVEIRALVASSKLVFADKTGKIDINNISFDKFIVLNDKQIETLLDSQIIRYSASKKTYEILNDGALKDYINLSGNESEDVDLVSSDLPNLLKVIRDLNEKGINYTEFTFDKFKEKIGDDETKADEISDILLTSQIICNSLSKMIGKVLDGALGVDSDMRKAVNLDMDKTETEGRNYWLDNPETKEIGEFKKIFRLLTCIDQFTNVNNIENNKNIKEASLIATPLKRINDSMVLRGIIPMFVEETTANVDAWKYSSGDNMYKDPYVFTKEEWDQEIDNISTIISLVNANSLTLGGINVKETDLKVLKMILKEVAKSRILNIACIEKAVKEGVDNTFFGGKDTVTVAKVYDGKDYNEKVLAWNGNEENQGEIDKLYNALEVLKTIKSTEINGTADGQANAKVIGSFLDKCKESKMLRSVIITIVNEKYGISISEDKLQDSNFSFEEYLPMVALLM